MATPFLYSSSALREATTVSPFKTSTSSQFRTCLNSIVPFSSATTVSFFKTVPSFKNLIYCITRVW